MDLSRTVMFTVWLRYMYFYYTCTILTCHSRADHIETQNQVDPNNQDLKLEDLAGHLRKFGAGKQAIDKIDEIDGYPSVQDFFHNYALVSRPLIMRNAGKHSPAYSYWTDEYFLSLPVPADNLVLVETRKKEDRNQQTFDLHFKDFVRTYNTSGHYMVNNVPEFLQKDVIIPGPLQCPYIYDNIIIDAIMWFSSGGTKSVVHTDAVENINCIYKGEKEFVMVDPLKYKNKEYMDHPEGAYSAVDVDSVDYTKYPGLAEVEYQTVKLSPGDCLYIPYKWIHQVRSYGRNLAVNIWWNYHRNKEVNIEECPTEFDPTLTLEEVTFQGFEDVTNSVEAVRDHFTELLSGRSVDQDSFITIIVPERGEIEEINPGIGFTLHIQKIFELLDVDGDGQVSGREIEHLDQQVWEGVRDQMQRVDTILRELDGQWAEEMDDEEGNRDLLEDYDYHDEL